MLQYARAHGDGVQSGRAFFARALRVLNIALRGNGSNYMYGQVVVMRWGPAPYQMSDTPLSWPSLRRAT